nr:phosphatidylinositol 4-phosphate 3-kinase C2 domain-containing subunit alpha-like [Ciona intestinalis]|eukprot:XP_009859078.1 phosphatidylinositol 4-phosphate 3-kinase C2 domain-containing subunit alpha-like [Ciona intestinalis]
MSDIKSALLMEAEAMQRMKKNRDSTLRVRGTGIVNPMCGLQTTSTNHQISNKTSKLDAPDLMSFNDALPSSGDTDDWTAFESGVSSKIGVTSTNNDFNPFLITSNINNQASQPQNIFWSNSSTYHKTLSQVKSFPNINPTQNFTPTPGRPATASPSTSSEDMFFKTTSVDSRVKPFPAVNYRNNSTQQSMDLNNWKDLHNLYMLPRTQSFTHQPFKRSNQASFSLQNPNVLSSIQNKAAFKRPASCGSFNGLRPGSFSENVTYPATNPFSTANGTQLNFPEMKAPTTKVLQPAETEVKEQVGGWSGNYDHVFDDWFKDVKEQTSTPGVFDTEGVKQQPDWLEWDPLHQTGSEWNSSKDALAPDASPSANTSPSKVQSMSPARERDIFGLYDADTPEDDNVSPNLPQNEVSSVTELNVDSATDLERFAHMVAQLRAGFTHLDQLCNPGHVVGLMVQSDHAINTGDRQQEDDDSTVRVSISADGITQPVTFECDINSSVEHIVSQALCIAYEDISLVSTDDYAFKIIGRQEYLLSKTHLGMYHYVRECIKFEQDVTLELVHKTNIDHSLRRTHDDDNKQTVMKEFLSELGKPSTVLSRDDIQILLDAFYKEAEKLLDLVKTEPGEAVLTQQCDRLMQTVKATCCSFGYLETLGITDAAKTLWGGVLQRKPTSSKQDDGLVHDLVKLDQPKQENKEDSPHVHCVRAALEQLTSVLLDISQLYCKAFEVDAYSLSNSLNATPPPKDKIKSTQVKDLYSVHIMSLHRFPKPWETQFEDFHIICHLYHGEEKLSSNNASTKPTSINKSFYPRVVWDTWVEFDIRVCDLPLETTLRVYLHGTVSSDDKVTSRPLCWLNIPLFDHRRVLRYESCVFGMHSMSKLRPKTRGAFHGPLICSDDITNIDNPILLLQFAEEKNPTTCVVHSQVEEHQLEPVKWQNLESLQQPDALQKVLGHAKLTVGPLCNLSPTEKAVLWNHRHIIGAPDCATASGVGLPLLLRCVPTWSPSSPHPKAAYQLLSSWPQRPQPEESLALLSGQFPDTRVRTAAIRWLEAAEDMDIVSWLSQLVQALRQEQHHDSPLARLLLRRALGSVRIAHKLFWLLRENKTDELFGPRYKIINAALLTTCGSALKKEFDKEVYFLKKVHRVAESVKEAKDSIKQSTLTDELSKISSRIGGHKFRVPTNPALIANGINVKNSSYFNSNAIPIKISFMNSCKNGGEINIMYKVGDDIRQDALTMQLIRVMENMWLAEGLDLRIVTFDCLPTGLNQGLVELIGESKTLREIQSSYGLTGAFKDRPIAEWLEKYNPTGISYEKAVENFTLSCAGYCVATYVLGICDRHNDNIMLRSSGHLFHIDFARFLGHAQMFGNIKRDRAPFVLTSDMAYVINGGDRPSSQFQDFVDVCCRAFNIVRSQSHVIINLLSLMLDCGIPELSSKSDLKYVYDALKPNAAETEATTMFTRLIESSLSSSFTRFNFFIHNLAQLRFLSNDEDDKNTLSFAPQLQSHRDEDGTIAMATVVGYQKRYSPGKYYMFCVKVTREKNTTTKDSYVFRTFSEFEELHRKLSFVYPSKLPSFSDSVVVGRSQVKQVAERRKIKLNSYLSFLFKSQKTIAMHDLVYTFFHPILRDEEKVTKTVPKSPDLTVGGEIKVSLHYKNNYILILKI